MMAAALRVRSESPLVVIVGPTASGKTGLAVEIAKQFGGEIISADSRAIYKGLDIGTAKPRAVERQGVPHWGIDLVDPGERFTAADFQRYSFQKIKQIRERGNIPILVGGTGLYINSVVYQYGFPEGGDDLSRRSELTTTTLDDLHEYCRKNSIRLPENEMNKRYVINAILRNGSIEKRRQSISNNTVVVGITTEKEVLRDRISRRARAIVGDETITEACRMADKFGWDNEAMKGNIYPLIHRYMDGCITKEQMIERFKVLDWRLAKRQLTWFKRDPYIRWYELQDAYTFLARYLEDLNNS